MPIIVVWIAENRVRPAQNAGRMREAWTWVGRAIFIQVLFTAFCMLGALAVG